MKKRDKTYVFMTGATGVMGSAGLKELFRYPETYEVCVLARPSKKNRRQLESYIKNGLKVIWGDLLEEESLKKGIENADVVLHVGGMVSPAAEHYPQKTMKVNVGSTKLISKIIKEMEDKDSFRTIKMVYIGSVSQYGSHLPPEHWGSVGDRMECARFDAYALSKILAEQEMVKAGIRRWVSLRQTAILHAGLFKKVSDPVTFHVPLRGAIEWISAEDSGRLLERVCREDIPDNFWNNFYNMGGGERFRLTNYEFEEKILKAIGCPSPEKIFDTNWFASDNFHGIWFRDSGKLDEIFHYREDDSFEIVIDRIKRELPFYYRMAPLAPAFLIKWYMKRVASKSDLGPLYWIKSGDKKRIEAAWGSREAYGRIPSWKKIMRENLPRSLDAGTYWRTDSSKENNELKGKKCERGHSYLTSKILEAGGHGCPECLREDCGLHV